MHIVIVIGCPSPCVLGLFMSRARIGSALPRLSLAPLFMNVPRSLSSFTSLVRYRSQNRTFMRASGTVRRPPGWSPYGRIVVRTWFWFQRWLLSKKNVGEGDPRDLIRVKVEIDAEDPELL